MGGEVSKDKLVPEIGKPTSPKTYFRLTGEYSWLCGGSIPCFNENLDFLEQENIGMIISLTVVALKPGLNIHHLPFDHNNTEWIFGDIYDVDEFNKTFDHKHVPCADGGPFDVTEARRLLRIVKRYHKLYPEKGIYLHCWQGKGRTVTAIRYILQKLYNFTYEDSEKMVPLDIKSPFQRAFLQGEEIPKGIYEMFIPEIKTPKDHKCMTLVDPWIGYLNDIQKRKGVCPLENVKIFDVTDIMKWTPDASYKIPDWLTEYCDEDCDYKKLNPSLLIHLCKMAHPDIDGIKFKENMTGNRIRKIFDVIETISFVPLLSIEEKAILSYFGRDKSIQSGELLNLPHVGTMIDYFININEYEITGIIYADRNLWKVECERGMGTIYHF